MTDRHNQVNELRGHAASQVKMVAEELESRKQEVRRRLAQRDVGLSGEIEVQRGEIASFERRLEEESSREKAFERQVEGAERELQTTRQWVQAATRELEMGKAALFRMDHKLASKETPRRQSAAAPSPRKARAR